MAEMWKPIDDNAKTGAEMLLCWWNYDIPTVALGIWRERQQDWLIADIMFPRSLDRAFPQFYQPKPEAPPNPFNKTDGE